MLYPITFSGISLLDGRNRLDALAMAGLLAVNEAGLLCLRIDGEERTIPQRHARRDEDPYALAISLNIHRRHLTAEQKRDLVAKLLKMQSTSSDRAIAKITKVSDKTVGAVRRDLEGRAEIPHVKARTDTKGRKQPARKPKSVAKAATEVTARGIAADLTIPAAAGAPTLCPTINPIVAAWDKVELQQRREFLKDRWTEILRALEGEDGDVVAHAAMEIERTA